MTTNNQLPEYEFSVLGENLKSAIADIKKFAIYSRGHVGYEAILIEVLDTQIKLMAYGGDTTIMVTIGANTRHSKPGLFWINDDIIKTKFSNDRCDFTIGGSVMVKNGDTALEYERVYQDEDTTKKILDIFAEYEKCEIGFSVIDHEMKSALETTLIATARNNDNRPVLQSVKFESAQDGIKLIAADAYRLAVTDVYGEYRNQHNDPNPATITFNHAISNKGLIALASRLTGKKTTKRNGINYIDNRNNHPVKIHVAEDGLFFAYTNMVIMVGKLEGTYPNWKPILPDQNKAVFSLTLDCDELLRRLERITETPAECITIEYDREHDNDRITISNDTRKQSATMTIGKRTIHHAVTDFTIYINKKYLGEFIKAVKSEVTLHVIDRKTAFLFTTENGQTLYIVMPMNEPKNAAPTPTPNKPTVYYVDPQPQPQPIAQPIEAAIEPATKPQPQPIKPITLIEEAAITRKAMLEIKANHPEKVLLYKVGDKYCMTNEDLRIAAVHSKHVIGYLINANRIEEVIESLLRSMYHVAKHDENGLTLYIPETYAKSENKQAIEFIPHKPATQPDEPAAATQATEPALQAVPTSTTGKTYMYGQSIIMQIEEHDIDEAQPIDEEEEEEVEVEAAIEPSPACLAIVPYIPAQPAQPAQAAAIVATQPAKPQPAQDEPKAKRERINYLQEEGAYEQLLATLAMLPAKIRVELIGTWVWVSGDTKPVKEELKKLGFSWHAKKICWYLALSGEYKPNRRANSSKLDIKRKYGVTTILDAE